ncbi:helix-turn-helix domain-containing protein [Robiginitalea sp. IMCC44478]|uniref:helix-turn-helix domain-containing protein n=1 Tax=Robiginitalea sp. IMCC44478 TaxID=3459122 RepID=UPI0040414B55
MSTIIQILYLIVIFQTFFIGLFLMGAGKGRKLSNRLLGCFFFCLGAGLVDFYLLVNGYYQHHSQYVFFLNSLAILHAPLLLLYTQSLTNPRFRLRWVHLFHAIPFLLALGLLLQFYYNQTSSTREFIMEEVVKGQATTTIVISLVGFVYELVYLISIKMLIYNYRKKLKEHFSNLAEINLNWLSYLVNIFIISFLASALSSILRHSQTDGFNGWVLVFALAGTFYFINSILLKGLHQNKLFLGVSWDSETNDASGDSDKNLLQKLKQHLLENKPYLDPELSLGQLAKQMHASPRQLSALINKGMGKSFFDLINNYRIEEAKRVLKESTDPGLTVLEVMYEVGFNSKSSFNTAFKKYTGLTPTAYKNRIS